MNDQNNIDEFKKLEAEVWLSTEEAARYLRRSANAIRILVHRKVLKFRKFSRRLYFKREELDALLEGLVLHGGHNGNYAV